MKSTRFWDVTPCSLVELHLRFGAKYYVNLQFAANLFLLVCITYFYSVKMEVECCS
jgi:hypothetical protein